MPSRLADIIAYTRSLVDENRDSFATNEEIRRWLNNAQRHIGLLIINANDSFYSASQRFTYPANTVDVPIPSPFIKIQTVEDESRTPSLWLKPIPYNDRFKYESSYLSNTLGRPLSLYYYLLRNRITLVPRPLDARTLKVNYIPQFRDMDNPDDEPDIPEEHREILAVYAAMRYYEKDEASPDQLVVHYQQLKQQLMAAVERRRVDTARYVVYDDDDFAYY